MKKSKTPWKYDEKKDLEEARRLRSYMDERLKEEKSIYRNGGSSELYDSHRPGNACFLFPYER